jgi:hypothetical protein
MIDVDIVNGINVNVDIIVRLISSFLLFSKIPFFIFIFYLMRFLVIPLIYPKYKEAEKILESPIFCIWFFQKNFFYPSIYFLCFFDK